MLRVILRAIPFLICLAVLPVTAAAEPKDYSSPELRPILVKPDRAMGRLLIKANFSNHRIIVDGAEYPGYLIDSGIEVTSNEIHEVTVSNGSAEKKYRLSVNPSETFMLYVDLGKTSTNAKKDDKKKDEKKKDDAATGFLSITADSEAQVYVDGKLVSSKTPLQKHTVNTGSHTVRVYFFDTRKFSKSREIYVGRGANMSMHFAKE